jgi:23S rRNA pseudouridine2604 synthase
MSQWSPSIRLNKCISDSGFCSRRKADEYIQKGMVKINGRKAKIGDMVKAGQTVLVSGFEIIAQGPVLPVLIMLNKPAGITSTTETSVKGNMVDYVNHPQRIFPIGRLDKDSQGLIFLTNDGDAVNKILRSGNKHEKEYIVTVDKALTDEAIKTMSQGVPMLGTHTKKCLIVKEGPMVFRITLIQGLNRQIRRMCEFVGYQVRTLERVRIMHVALGNLPVGDWRELSEKEMSGITKAMEDSSSEVMAKQGTKKTPKTPSRSTTKQSNASPSRSRPKTHVRPADAKRRGKPVAKGRGRSKRR